VIVCLVDNNMLFNSAILEVITQFAVVLSFR